MNTRKLSLALRNISVERYRLAKDGRKWKAKARDRQSLANWLGTFGDGDGTRVAPGIKTMMRHFGWSHGKTCSLLSDLKQLKLLESPVNSEGKWQRFQGKKNGTRLRKMNVAAFLAEVTVQYSTVTVRDSAESLSEIEQSPSNVTLDGTVTRPTQILPPLTPPLAREGKTVMIGHGGRAIEITIHHRKERTLLRKFWTTAKASVYVGAQTAELIARFRSIGLDAKDSAQNPAAGGNPNLLKMRAPHLREVSPQKEIVVGS